MRPSHHPPAPRSGSLPTVAGLLFALVGLLPRPSAALATIGQVDTLLEQWQLEDALGRAEEIFREDPNNPQVWLLAARVQHQRGEHLSAWSLIRAAEAEGEAAEPTFRSLVQTAARYQTHFETLESDHFRIRYLNKDEIVAQLARPILEAAYQNIGGDLGLLPAERGEKIVVEIFPDARGLAGVTGLTLKEIETSGTIAVCKFHRLMITSPLATINGYDWADTIAHEFTHLVISKRSRNNIPIWLHEGIAKYYESRWKGPAGRALEPFSETLLQNALQKKKLITFEQMHPSMALLPSQKDAALAFAEVFTTIEFVQQRFGARAVPEILARAASGAPLERILKKVLGVGLAGLEKRWHQYLLKRPFHTRPGASLRPIRLASSESDAQQERPLEEIKDQKTHQFSRLGELLQLRGHHPAAIIEYEKARKRSGLRYPTLINRLARAYVQTHQPDTALSLLDQLFVVHPSNSDAHLLAGRLLLKAEKLDPAEQHLLAVCRQNPFNPEVHLLLTHLHQQKGDAAAAKRAERFFQLARTPRPTRRYALAAPPAGDARLSVLTSPWGRVRINNGQPRATPAWKVPVPSGPVTLQILGAHTGAPTRLTLKPDEDRIVVLP